GRGLDLQPPLVDDLGLGAHAHPVDAEQHRHHVSTVEHVRGLAFRSATFDKSQNREAPGRAGGPPMNREPTSPAPTLQRVEPDFPTPPWPTIVTSRLRFVAAATAASSRRRPTSRVTGAT